MSEIGAQKPIEAVLSDQPLSEHEKDLVREAYGRLAVFERGCAEYHQRARDDRETLRLRDPHQDVAELDANGNVIGGNEPLRKTLQVQTLKSTFNNSVADQMDNMPEARMRPERPDLQEMAEDMTDAVHFVMERNRYPALHRRCVEDYLGVGTVVTQQMWDPDMDNGRGDIAILRWPLENFLWDPMIENIQESRALIKVAWYPMSWFAAHYPEQAPYVNAEDNQHNNVGVPTTLQDTLGEDEGRAMLMEYWYRRYDAAEKKYSINVAYLAGGALLLNKEKIYAHGMYPFVVLPMSPIEGTPAGDGMVSELAPMMRYINRYIHCLDENIRFSSAAKMLVDARAGVDPNDLADMSKRIITGKNLDNFPPQWLQTAPLTSVATNQLLHLQSDLKQDSGQNQFSRGETAGGVTAFSAIDALQAAGAKITRLRTLSLNQSYQEIVEQVIWLMSEFYTEGRKRMITGRDGNQREVDMTASRLFGERLGDAVPPPPYSVQVQVQRSNPLRIQAMNETAIKAYSMAAQAGQFFPLSVLFEIIDFDGKDRILPILRALEEQQDAIQQLAAENEQLKQGMSNLQSANAQMSQELGGQSMGQPPDGMEEEGLPMQMEAAPS